MKNQSNKQAASRTMALVESNTIRAPESKGVERSDQSFGRL